MGRLACRTRHVDLPAPSPSSVNQELQQMTAHVVRVLLHPRYWEDHRGNASLEGVWVHVPSRPVDTQPHLPRGGAGEHVAA